LKEQLGAAEVVGVDVSQAMISLQHQTNSIHMIFFLKNLF
jgi:hypothetical protein